MFNKPFDQIGKDDIEALITDEVQERRQLEYKQALPENGKKQDTIEFLADVSSFANASGGYIIYGIEDKRDSRGKATGKPGKVVGLPGVNTDQAITRLEQKIRSGIDPKVPLETKSIDDFGEGPLILMRIPQSWASPHMVKFEGVSRFYSRSSNGKHLLDVHEIRAAFALSEALPERIRRFRDDRLAKIIADETPAKLENIAKTVIHILPVVSFSQKMDINLKGLAHNATIFHPMTSDGNCGIYNFDGLLAHYPRDCESREYTQLFRNGVIEAVSTKLTRKHEQLYHIRDVFFENTIIQSVEFYLNLLYEQGCVPPIYICISLLGVKGYGIGYTRSFDSSHDINPIERDMLIIPEMIVEDSCSSIDQLMRPAFDSIWQASGWPGSPNYNAEGKWVGQ